MRKGLSNNAQIRELLTELYTPDVADDLAERIASRLTRSAPRQQRAEAWSPADVMLITYADAVRADGQAPLLGLRDFLKTHFDGLISLVHLLPFFPYTSDDGFAVSDYRAVDPNHGSWDDVSALAKDVSLVFDLVINHASSAHPLFLQFLKGQSPANDYFLTAEPDVDLREVTRPRATPVLQTYETALGPREVWCTFSRDQVDWDFSNPNVLLEFIDIFLTYIERGASWIRLDAIAYLWKEIGTTCIHLPQTHAAVKLLRAVAEQVSTDIKILTETNVPLPENLSYFGDGDEAHIVYNFSLPPLVVQGLLTGNSAHLSRWCRSLPPLPAGCTYLNFTASHDGIGLRPAEGILSDEELRELTDCIQRFGGRLTQRQRPDGTLSPYEANIALFDALQGTVRGKDNWQVERFLVSQAIMMAFAGVPALYYSSLLAAPNYNEGVAQTGRSRTINRRKWTMAEVEAHWSNANGPPMRVLQGLREMLSVRREQRAFHPEGLQMCVEACPHSLLLLRTSPSGEQCVFCVFNLSDEPIELPWPSSIPSQNGIDGSLFTQGDLTLDAGVLGCSPYAIGWFDVSR